jgi:hypothetical protein
MYYLHKIFEGNLKNHGSASFRYTANEHKKVCGAFCSGDSSVSLAFRNKGTVVLHNLHFGNAMDSPPNKRPLLFPEKIAMDMASGVVTGGIKKDVSVYLIVEK